MKLSHAVIGEMDEILGSARTLHSNVHPVMSDDTIQRWRDALAAPIRGCGCKFVRCYVILDPSECEDHKHMNHTFTEIVCRALT